MSHSAKTIAIVVAAGQGSRAAMFGDAPKQYRPIAGVPLLARTISALGDCESIDAIVPVISKDHAALFDGLNLNQRKLGSPVFGGATRQISVLNGLSAIADKAPDIVLIHDGARPFVSSQLVDNIISALEGAQGSLPVTVVTDTIKRSLDGKTVGGTEDRTQLFAAQTPQGFLFKDIFDAHRRAIEFGDGFTDDAAIAEWAGLSVALAQGDPKNIKITLPDDFERAERLLKGDERSMETRVGTGFDVHAFTSGDTVILGNIKIPHTAKLSGHSDADVVLHALADALYGALAEGDIGKHFPPSDMKWKDADSTIFLNHAASRVRARGGRIVHLDVTIICEQPKIGPHVDSMRARIAEIAEIAVDRVSVKATTSERLGFTGRGEGIAAQSAAAIELPRI